MNIQSILATKGVHVMTIRPEQSIREAIVLFVTHNIGALVVADQRGRVVGLLAERDIIRAAPHYDQFLSTPVQAMMNRDVITVTPHDDLWSVAKAMTEKRLRHMPVVHEGKLEGIVSIGDVVKAQLDQYRGTIDTMEIQLLTIQV
jgi:CBS domain-containing protein